jgi:hypothetical protein
MSSARMSSPSATRSSWAEERTSSHSRSRRLLCPNSGMRLAHDTHARTIGPGAARAWWPIQSSKLAGPGSPRLGRFDSFAASLKGSPGIRASLGSSRAVRPDPRAGSTRANSGPVVPPAVPPSVPPGRFWYPTTGGHARGPLDVLGNGVAGRHDRDRRACVRQRSACARHSAADPAVHVVGSVGIRGPPRQAIKQKDRAAIPVFQAHRRPSAPHEIHRAV